MSELGVEGYRAERAALLEVVRSLSDDELQQPSDCAGWAVRDVLGHLAATIHGVVDPTYLVDMTNGTEAAMEAPVAERRNKPFADVLAEYETCSTGAADAFASLQAEGVRDTPITMPELGTHPMSMLANLFLFDTYTHLRVDILAPTGSIDRPEPPRDEARLRPTVEWMLAGLPWMCADALAPIVDRPLLLVLEGPGGGSWTVAPGGDGGRVAVTAGRANDAAATVCSGDHDFVVWGTTRRPWSDFVKIDGDDAYAARFLDVVNII